MKTAAIDFETYYDKNCSIKNLGGYQYTHHKDFDAYMVSIVTSEGDEFIGHPSEFDFSCITGEDWEWVSHNARFDIDVYLTLAEKEDLPFPENWYCTADMSAYLQMPRSLEKMVETAYNKTLKKSVRSNMTGRKYDGLTDFEKRELREYALEDSRWCLKAWLDFGKFWPQHEREISVANRVIGQQGVYIDVPYLQESINSLDGVMQEAEKKIPWIERGEKPLSTDAIKEECDRVGIPKPSSFAKTSEDFDKWIEEYGEKVEFAKAVGQYRSANALQKKAQTMLDYRRPDGTMELQWLYFGAHTGRFSGTGGFNSQNLPRGSIFGVDLRRAIIPPKDHVIITCDASNIEFRTLMYFAGDKQMLKTLREGFNPYEAVAKMIGGWDGEKGTLKKTDPQMYATYKAIALGCGFGMGPERFIASAISFTGGAYRPNFDQALENIRAFRSTIPSAPNLWRRLDDAIQSVANKNPGKLIIKLPSGRKLLYRDIKGEVRDFKATTIRKGNFARTKIYGGLLAENLSQALARDIFTWHLLKCLERDINVVMHTHDEIVCYAHKEDALRVNCLIRSIMRTCPPWIDIPLDVESEICEHYKK